jgi:hypothetical protein
VSAFGVQVAPGDGLAARYGGSVVLAPGDSPLADALLSLAREADRDHPDAPGRFLTRKVAGLVSQSDEPATVGVVSALEDGVAVLLVGDVTLTLTVDGVKTAQSGSDATTWVDRIVRGPWESLALSLASAGAFDPRSDLQGGTVGATAVLLLPAGAAPVAPAAEPVAEPPTVVEAMPPVVVPDMPVAAFESFALDEPVVDEPLPVAESRATAELSPEPNADVVTVQGIECTRQHFNDPTALYCSVCGISMVHQTHNLVSGPRPPLGVLVLDDGAVYTLDGDYVLGREPEGAPEVAAGTATPLPLDDPDVTMSRVHAKLLLVGWDVRLVDAGSVNGTFVARPGETEWTRIAAGEPVVLKPGTRMSIGGRTLVFDSHHKL